MNKNPGFTERSSPQALDEDVQLANPIAEALKRKRKLMATKMGDGAPSLDSYGTPTIEPEEGDQS